MEELDHQLYAITRVVPQPALDRIREIEIWAELKMPKTAMTRWFQVISAMRIRQLPEWTARQPASRLREDPRRPLVEVEHVRQPQVTS